MAKRRWRHRARAAEDVVARAARLGITPERVLREYARIAFSDIREIIQWDAAGAMKATTPSQLLGEDVGPSIAEIVASASNQTIYRVKLHDKKPVLDALARHLDMLPTNSDTDDDTALDGDTPQERLIRAFDRLEAEEAAGSGDPRPE